MKQINIKGFSDEQAEKIKKTTIKLNFKSVAEFIRKTILDLCDKVLTE